MNLRTYDWIICNSSAGKDSQAMLDVICRMAKTQGVLGRVVVVHSDLGRVEWQGTRELAETQACHYGVRFEVVQRPQGDLLTHIEERGMFPSSTTRYCTSDHKRGQVATLVTKLTNEVYDGVTKVRILNCLGFRAEESPARAKRVPFSVDARLTNGKRHVDCWLPIHDWSEATVWEVIKKSGVPYHFAYDLGMPRLSCCFCIFAPKAALLLAGKHNPELLEEYVRIEKKINHSFRIDLKLADVQAEIKAGAETGTITDWKM